MSSNTYANHPQDPPPAAYRIVITGILVCRNDPYNMEVHEVIEQMQLNDSFDIHCIAQADEPLVEVKEDTSCPS